MSPNALKLFDFNYGQHAVSFIFLNTSSEEFYKKTIFNRDLL